MKYLWKNGRMKYYYITKSECYIFFFLHLYFHVTILKRCFIASYTVYFYGLQHFELEYFRVYMCIENRQNTASINTATRARLWTTPMKFSRRVCLLNTHTGANSKIYRSIPRGRRGKKKEGKKERKKEEGWWNLGKHVFPRVELLRPSTWRMIESRRAETEIDHCEVTRNKIQLRL